MMNDLRNQEMYEGENQQQRVPANQGENLDEKKRPKIREADRKQTLLRAVDVERLVETDDRVRGIWAFVCGLKLDNYHQSIDSLQGEVGRAAWDPRVLLSLWLLGLSQGVNSAREISERCEYHPAYQWLTGMEIINHHTLSDFRTRDEGIEKVFEEMLGVLNYEGLIGLERMAHDGTKIKANASASSFHREATLQEHLQEARKHLEGLSNGDGQQSGRKEAAQRRAAEGRVQKVEAALKTINELQARKSDSKKEPRVSETDSEARRMMQADGGFAANFNAQLTTDAQAGIIVGASVTQSGNDRGLLSPALELVKNNLGSLPKEVLVDSDYATRETILEMADNQITLISSVVDRKGISDCQYQRRGVSEAFHADSFTYNNVENTFTCPAGKNLVFDRKDTYPGIIYFYYKARGQDCQNCPFKQQCCPKTQARTVSRNQEDPVIQEFNARMQTSEAKQIYKQRSQLAEFPNAWIKDKIRLRQFRLRGLIKVTMEFIWAAVTYNLQQWMRLRWLPKIALA